MKKLILCSILASSGLILGGSDDNDKPMIPVPGTDIPMLGAHAITEAQYRQIIEVAPHLGKHKALPDHQQLVGQHGIPPRVLNDILSPETLHPRPRYITISLPSAPASSSSNIGATSSSTISDADMPMRDWALDGTTLTPEQCDLLAHIQPQIGDQRQLPSREVLISQYGFKPEVLDALINGTLRIMPSPAPAPTAAPVAPAPDNRDPNILDMRGRDISTLFGAIQKMRPSEVEALEKQVKLAYFVHTNEANNERRMLEEDLAVLQIERLRQQNSREGQNVIKRAANTATDHFAGAMGQSVGQVLGSFLATKACDALERKFFPDPKREMVEQLQLQKAQQAIRADELAITMQERRAEAHVKAQEEQTNLLQEVRLNMATIRQLNQLKTERTLTPQEEAALTSAHRSLNVLQKMIAPAAA